MMGSNMKWVSELADVVGAEAALTVVGYFGGRTLYVPDSMPDGHLLVSLIGARPARLMARHLGGQTHSVPLLDLTHLRKRGLAVYLAAEHRLAPPWIARTLGLGVRRVQQIIDEEGLRVPNLAPAGIAAMGDDSVARQLARAGVPVRIIAVAMGRSEARIRSWIAVPATAAGLTGHPQTAGDPMSLPLWGGEDSQARASSGG
ncbi:hypothetical protein ACTSKR_11365 [Chitinibacteraceae bacterium HSL-7]